MDRNRKLRKRHVEQYKVRRRGPFGVLSQDGPTTA
jgi:hypothetical protein